MALAQLAEHRIVAPKVTGSSPVGHPRPSTNDGTTRGEIAAQLDVARSLTGLTLHLMQRPVDAVSAAVLKLQFAQRAVDTLIDELIERVSVDPFGESSYPDSASHFRSDGVPWIKLWTS